MSKPVRPTNVPTIQCDVCMKEIPTSEARNTEVQDYVMNFCGLDCYDLWHNKAKTNAPHEDGKEG